MSLRDVVDELHDHDRLADARAAEQADLAALHERRDQVDDLDARLEDFGFGLEVGELGSGTMDRPALDIIRNRRTVVDRIPEHVENPAERCFANRNRDWTAGVLDVHSANNRVGRGHRDCAHLVAADVLLHFDGHVNVGA